MKAMRKRAISICTMVAVMASTLLGSQSVGIVGAAAKVKVTYVNPPIAQLTLKTGEKYRLKINLSDKKKKKEVRFSSSNGKVVKVTQKGVIRGVKKGKATVSIRDKKKKIGKIKVVVVKKLKKVKKITINHKKATIEKGDNLQVKAVVAPQKATVKKVVYVSSNTKVATVNKTGKVVGKSVGTAKITVYAADGRGAKTSCTVTVQDKVTGNGTEETGSKGSSVTNNTPVPITTPSVAPQQTPASTKKPFQGPSEVEIIQGDISLFSADMTPSIYIDDTAEDAKGLTRVADSFAKDVELVSGVKGNVIHDVKEGSRTTIVAGVIGDNKVIDDYIAEGSLDVSEIQGKWESYQITTLKDERKDGKNLIVVAGSDKRGAIYGIYHISELMGVSPWAYWGDVVTPQVGEMTLSSEQLNVTSKEPSVKYRGIFLNDEAPSLTGWTKEKFDGYNEEFYEKVYELILRLKGNYLWPAMWSNCFSVDGTDDEGIANAKLADEYGVVMGTSHHEPMCRAGNEWSQNLNKYIAPSDREDGEGSGYYWNYDLFPDELARFWEDGVIRNKPFENVYTIGMRGEADSAMEMSADTFKKIITTQKSILEKQNLSDEPNVLVLYKEIEKMWYEGDGTGESIAQWDGLDDTTIMLCEDNFGNMRTLPTAENRDRKAGWGMYYHFDYHGGPRSYEWVNTVPLQKTWEQMSMAYDYGVDEMWIVNVGDLKPMEMNISYFLDMAYDFETWGTENKGSADEYTKKWVQQQFGKELDESEQADVVDIMTEYLNINGCRKPEIVMSNTYQVTGYNEAMTMLERCQKLMDKSETYMDSISDEMKAAYFQLVHYPAVASANVNQMQIYAALNEFYYNQDSVAANLYGKLMGEAIARDKELTDTYNNDMYQVGDKWKKMMSSPHVGYGNWNSEGWSYPQPQWVTTKAKSILKVSVEDDKEAYGEGSCSLPEFTSTNQEKYWVSVSNGGGITYDYTVTTSEDWIQCSKKSGTVTLQDMFAVGIDWSKVKENKVGKITITGADASVDIAVTAKVTDVSGLDEKTYVEEHDIISIDVSNYTDKKAGEEGADFAILKHYGKSNVAAKAYPTTKRFENYAQAPYLEYKIYVDSDGEYTLQTYTAPSNNVDWNEVTLRYGISVDGGEITTVDTVDKTVFVAGDHNNSNWSKGVMDNIRIASSKVSLTKGIHTLRFYAKDPALVLEKIVVYSGELKPSYLGPKESYYVGKEGAGTCYIPEYNDICYNLPGMVPVKAETTEYPVVLTTEGDYQYKLTATGESNGEVEVYVGKELVGTVNITGEGTYEVGEKTAVIGVSAISYVVTKGTVNISSIKASKKKEIMDNPVYLSASSGNAEYAYDGDEDTIWTPTTEDMEDGETSITVDFVDRYTVDHFEISGVAKGMTSYDVQLYDEGQFKTVFTGTRIDSGKAVYIQGKEEYKGSKMRLVFHGGTPKIEEVLVTPYVNWASEDKITLIGHDKKGAECDIPNTVMDGDRITKALESGTMGSGSDIVMEFTAPRKVNAVNVISQQESETATPGTGVIPNAQMTSNRAQTTYSAYYYENGKWILGGKVTQSDENKRKVLNTIEFAKEVTTEKVKVVINTSYWVRIVELEPMYQYQNSLSTLVEAKKAQ